MNQTFPDSVKFFASQDEFRSWLMENHQTVSELLVGYYRVETKKSTMTWSNSVDEALCFGWIDGIRRKINEEEYCIRFTPRNPKSNWSAVNIKKVEDLIMSGKMQPAGLIAFENRKKENSAIYSYENRPEKLAPEMELRFKENGGAWNFFTSQAASYQKIRIYWVMSAKLEETRLARLSKLIQASELGNKLF